jgi:hypothetical protein
MGVTDQRHSPAALGKRPLVPIVQEAGLAPEPVWTQRLEEKSSCLCRGSNLYRPVVQSVVRLSYPGSLKTRRWNIMFEVLESSGMYCRVV